MYLARGKDGKLGRQTRGFKKGLGYEIQVESPKSVAQRDVCVTNQSIDRDFLNQQMGKMKAAHERAQKLARRKSLQEANDQRKREGQAAARAAQMGKRPNMKNELLKRYFSKRSRMGNDRQTIRDLSSGRAMTAFSIPENAPVVNTQLPCNTAGVVQTPTADFKILHEVPDTEFMNVVAPGADFMSQYPVGNPITPNGAGSLSYGPVTDWDRFVFDSEQNVTRVPGGWDMRKRGGQIAGGTLLGRYNGYPVQSNFGRARDKQRRIMSGLGEFEDEIAYETETIPEEDYVGTDEDVPTETSEAQAEAEAEADSSPSWWEKLTSGITSGVAQGAQTGVAQAAQYQIQQALMPGQTRQGQSAPTRMTVTTPTNPITRAGAKVGLSPSMTYAVLGAIGIGTALVLLKRK